MVAKQSTRWLMGVLTVLFVYALVELTSCVGLSALGHFRNRHFTPILKSELSAEHREILGRLLRDETQYLMHSPTLGWTIRPNGESGLYRANSQGLRAEREYPQHPTAGFVRIATFGDSFTHGDDVSYDETWQAQLSRAMPSLEVLNFGVGAYGLDQAYLRYEQDGIAFNSDLVLIGLLVGDVWRHISVFRPFSNPPTGVPLSKPVFVVRDGELTLIENPLKDAADIRRLLESPEVVLPELGRRDYFFKTRYGKSRFDFLPSVRIGKMVFSETISRWGPALLDPDSEVLALTLKIFMPSTRVSLVTVRHRSPSSFRDDSTCNTIFRPATNRITLSLIISRVVALPTSISPSLWRRTSPAERSRIS